MSGKWVLESNPWTVYGRRKEKVPGSTRGRSIKMGITGYINRKGIAGEASA
jgi:hypothetical protein